MTGEDRLATELEALERSAPVDLPPRPPLPGRRRGPSPALSAAVTLGAALLLVIVGARWLEAIRPTASTGPFENGSPGTAPTPSTSPFVAELRWSVDAFLPESGAEPGAITPVGDRLIVTGSDRDGPAGWYSDDGGITWQRASILGGGDDRRPMALGSVAGNGPLLLSLGSVNVSANDADRRSVLWASTDLGKTWERLPDDAVPPRLYGLAAGGPGFVAIGNANPAAGGGPDVEPPHAAVWVSLDGRQWERLPDDATFQLSAMNAITEHDGLLVAAGSVRVGEDDRPAVWRSLDGRQWTRAELSSDPGPVQSIAAGPRGFVAVGTARQGGAMLPTAWLSTDGATWASETLDTIAGGVATDVAANQLGFVAAGRDVQVEDVPGLVWFVPVGGSPSRQDIGADVYGLVAVGDRFMGVGSCGPLADCYSDYLVTGSPASRSESQTPAT